jgi:hypothetical protein
MAKILRSIARLANKEQGPRGPGAGAKARRAIVDLQRLFKEQKTPPTDWDRVIRDMRDARTSKLVRQKRSSSS